MANIAQPDFKNRLLALLKETFEGPSGSESAYLAEGTGLLQTLDSLNAEAASRAPSGGGPTIAAHCAHLTYYARANHNYAVGRDQQVDWASSWELQQVGDREWEELKDRARFEYRALMETLERLEGWTEEAVGDSMAIVAHTAYHLGAIRHEVTVRSIC